MKYSRFLSINYWNLKLFGVKQKGIISKKEMYRYLPKNPVIVEAGAHIGSDTLEMAKFWHDATIHAFEPVPHLFQILSKNTTGISNIKIYSLALGEITGFVDIHISSGKSNGSSSLLSPKKHLDTHPNVLFKQKMTVSAITLDDWVIHNKVKQIDMLWLDLQGFELQVLKKSLSILRGVTVIYTEVNLIENYENCALYNELKQWLYIQGFEVVREELAWSDAGNVLFVSKNKIING